MKLIIAPGWRFSEMFALDQYELLDFGDGRKLERFGRYVLDRPSPAAEGEAKMDPELWGSANAQFRRKEGQKGVWLGDLPRDWEIACREFRLQLKPTEVGHLGVFPEQAANWSIINKCVSHAISVNAVPPKVLNLFAYTGGSSLAAAAAGAEVVHVDSARNVVSWARKNADISTLGDAKIRWIDEDARKFVEREIRRGNSYDIVILDPPSYGHGPKGQVWKLAKDLMPLLEMCGELTKQNRLMLLLTCHSTGISGADLEAMLADAVYGSCQAGAVARPMWIPTADGRRLRAGLVARG